MTARFASIAWFGIALLTSVSGFPCSGQQVVDVDLSAQQSPFPHFWEQMFGSGRAILSLREDYRDDLRSVKQITDFRYVRFHGILDDEVGVYTEDEHGNAVYNFAYVDEIYGGLLKNGVRPVVEISFMPRKLAFNPDALHPFWYKPDVSPPKSMERWDALITALARHLVEHFGIDEVAQWYFEMWNEPNIDFWNGIPRQKSYFVMYEHTARDLKAVSSRLRVGGPATAAAAWVPDFLRYVSENDVPIDFVSTHGYADDTVEDLFGTHEQISMNDRVGRAVAKVRTQIGNSARPHLPLLWTEWNVPGENEVRDTDFVGPALANTIRECDGLVNEMSFWTFSDVFEEGGPIGLPFEGHFGLRAKGGINKPSYYDFSLLHRLGEVRLNNPSPDVLVTKRQDGALVIAIWNLAALDKPSKTKTVRLRFRHLAAGKSAYISRVDNEHSNTLAAYKAVGSPRYPSEEQVAKMNDVTKLAPPVVAALGSGYLDFDLEPNALFLIEVR
jgi:xylan 1,4-beta-xylosidase